MRIIAPWGHHLNLSSEVSGFGPLKQGQAQRARETYPSGPSGCKGQRRTEDLPIAAGRSALGTKTASYGSS